MKWCVLTKPIGIKEPMVYDNEGNVIQYATITDFVVNPQCPTISLSHNGMSKIDVRTVSEMKNIHL